MNQNYFKKIRSDAKFNNNNYFSVIKNISENNKNQIGTPKICIEFNEFYPEKHICGRTRWRICKYIWIATKPGKYYNKTNKFKENKDTAFVRENYLTQDKLKTLKPLESFLTDYTIIKHLFYDYLYSWFYWSYFWLCSFIKSIYKSFIKWCP